MFLVLNIIVPFTLTSTSIMFLLKKKKKKNLNVLPKLMLIKVGQYQLNTLACNQCNMIITPISFQHREKNVAVMFKIKEILCTGLMNGMKHRGKV